MSVSVPQVNTHYGGIFIPVQSHSTGASHERVDTTCFHSQVKGSGFELSELSVVAQPKGGSLPQQERESFVSIPEAEKRVKPWVSLTLGILGFLS